jgi:hypothetical protein
MPGCFSLLLFVHRAPRHAVDSKPRSQRPCEQRAEHFTWLDGSKPKPLEPQILPSALGGRTARIPDLEAVDFEAVSRWVSDHVRECEGAHFRWGPLTPPRALPPQGLGLRAPLRKKQRQTFKREQLCALPESSSEEDDEETCTPTTTAGETDDDNYSATDEPSSDEIEVVGSQL